MYRLVVEMLREAHRLAGDEGLANKAKARMTAMLVASNLTRTGEAILRGYEKGYLQPIVDELVNLIEQLKEQLEQARQAGQESAPTSATT
jgi:phosphoserine phosphatase